MTVLWLLAFSLSAVDLPCTEPVCFLYGPHHRQSLFEYKCDISISTKTGYYTWSTQEKPFITSACKSHCIWFLNTNNMPHSQWFHPEELIVVFTVDHRNMTVLESFQTCLNRSAVSFLYKFWQNRVRSDVKLRWGLLAKWEKASECEDHLRNI